MTDRELQRLRRSDLLELLIQQTEENQRLRAALEKAEQELESRRVTVERAGSLAEAALQLNGVFSAAQAACDQYRQNVEEQCKALLESTRAECEELRRQAEQSAAPEGMRVEDMYLEQIIAEAKNL